VPARISIDISISIASVLVPKPVITSSARMSFALQQPGQCEADPADAFEPLSIPDAIPASGR
jgi:hypothetical protein